MHSHIGCICLAFLHCAFSNVSSNGLPEKRHIHIGRTFFTFLHCAFSNVSSNFLPERMQSHIDCICLTFLHCAFSNVSSNGLLEQMHSHIGCICLKIPEFLRSKTKSDSAKLSSWDLWGLKMSSGDWANEFLRFSPSLKLLAKSPDIRTSVAQNMHGY